MMSGRILIIDAVATNRIVLKVKMHAAQYAVDTCENRVQAAVTIAKTRPDVILLSLNDPSEDRHAFCRDLKADPETADISIIALGVPDTSRARFAALDAGADEVIPNTIDDTFLVARTRSLMRMRNTHAELWLRSGTSRALGFEEEHDDFAHQSNVVAVTTRASNQNPLIEKLNSTDLAFKTLSPEMVLTDEATDQIPDLLVIDGTEMEDAGRDAFRIIADLRARSETRLSMQLVVVKSGMPEIASMALDLGADDIVFDHVSKEEFELRMTALTLRKTREDRLRATVRDGLHAAVTDSLTGLYNRRYAEPHLIRMEQQARKLGQEFAIMMLDIDHFKAVNDTFGHAAGDKILKDVAERLRNNLRAFDLIARVGGEEFLIAMPDTDTLKAKAAANRLRMIIDREPFYLAKGQPRLPVTMSIGVAIGGEDALSAETSEVICTRADTALYAAKAAGRNQVALAGSAA
jgi:two-component system, cell cycle response regulator